MKNGLIFDIKGYAIHDGPGIRSSVFFKGCPLNCSWCHNPESWSRSREIIIYQDRCLEECRECVQICHEKAIHKDGRVIISKEQCTLCPKCEATCPTNAIQMIGEEREALELVDELQKDFIFYDQSGGGITLTGGEPLMQVDFLKEILKEARQRFIRTTVDTCGYCSWEDLESIVPLVDVFLYDLKIMDDEMHIKYTKKSNQKIIKNLIKLSDVHKDIEVRIPIIPGITESDENIDRIIDLLTGEIKTIKRIALLKYHNFGDSKREKLQIKTNKIEYKDSELMKRMSIIKQKFQKKGFEVSIGG